MATPTAPASADARGAGAVLPGRHEDASALLAAVHDIVVERATGAAPPSWCVRRGWTEFLAALPEDFVLAAARDGLAAHVAAAPGAPPDLIALAEEVRRVTALPGPVGGPGEPVDGRRASQRKRAQVAAFGALVASLPGTPARIVDVGSGHGHLTRHLARTAGVPTEGWERDPGRVAVALALGTGARVQYCTADLRDTGVRLSPHDLVVGLHACGELGELAVQAARAAGASVAFVGCCLQKRPGDRAPLVVPPGLPAAALTIPHDALGLANTRTGETGVEADLATRTRGRRQRVALAWALGAAGHPVAPGEELRGVNRRRASGDFATLAALAFRARGLAAPTRAALDEAVRASAQHYERERRWELPRTMLGRLLEVWTALDRGATLAAGGYEAEVVLAFDASASPRNVALRAWRPAEREASARPRSLDP